MEQHLPDRSNRYQAGYVREERNGSEESSPDNLLVQHNCQSQRRYHGQRHGADTVNNGVFKGCAEERIARQLFKILKSYKLHRIAAVPLHESQCKSENNRNQGKYHKSDKVGCNKGISYQGSLGLAA